MPGPARKRGFFPPRGGISLDKSGPIPQLTRPDQTTEPTKPTKNIACVE